MIFSTNILLTIKINLITWDLNLKCNEKLPNSVIQHQMIAFHYFNDNCFIDV